MCDYSLENVASRPAKVGDKLTTKIFLSGTLGFSGVNEPEVAVCLLPGTELAFDRGIKLRDWVIDTFNENHTVARFAQENLEIKNIHHDVLEFPDDTRIQLNKLAAEQTATVLQMPAQPTVMHVDLPAESEGCLNEAEVVAVA